MHFYALPLLTALAAAAPTSNHVLHERRAIHPEWNKSNRLHGDVKLPMRIGLTQSNLDKGYDMLMSVSHPESSSYGKHYTAEEVIDLFAPAADAVESVRNWLHSAGIEASRVSQSANKQWLQFDAKTEEAEALFNTKYHFFEHATSGKTTIACDEYHVPAHVQQHIDYITPGIRLFVTGTKKPSRSEIEKRSLKLPPILKPLPPNLPVISSLLDLFCDEVITPYCIKDMYNITDGTLSAAGNQLGIFEDLGDYYAQADLNEFFLSLATYIPIGTAPELRGIDGATAPTTVANAGAESDLDFQISYPIIWPQGSVLFQTDDANYESNYQYDGFLNNFLDAIDGSYCSYSAYGETGNSDLDPPYPDTSGAAGAYTGNLQCGIYKPTNVISISYGGGEAYLPPSYQERQCNEFMKLGLQGVSVCVSSGDSGVAQEDSTGAATVCLGPDNNVFNPDFPATCPYLTTLGATYLPPGANAKKDEETAVTRFPSGGGFSNIYPIPDYQASAVAAYFANNNPPYEYYSCTNNTNCYQSNSGVYNRIGRGYPDFAAVGDNVLIYNKGAPTLIGGTSASSPVFASILTRINEERIAAGKSTVGFVNPTLYAHPEVLHDITIGSNPGCGEAGFSCAKGWDPVTGLGTPNYPAMLELFMGMA